MNFQKLKKSILDLGINKVAYFLEEGYHDDCDYDEEDEDDEEGKAEDSENAKIKKEVEELTAQLVLVHESGGYSGGGEEVERIFMHKDKDEKIYIKISGFYSSYEGTEWSETIERMQPEQKTVTIYTKYK
jgi:hypothetical protein